MPLVLGVDSSTQSCKVLVCDADTGAVLRQGRAAHPPGTEIDPAAWRNHRDALSDAELIFSTWGIPTLDEEFLEAAPSLEAVFYAAGTVKGFVTPAAVERGLVISSAAEANGLPVAEYCLAVILLSLKNFWAYPRQDPADKFTKIGGEPHGVYGATVGLVSLGAVGRRLADLLANHEVRVIVHDPYLEP